MAPIAHPVPHARRPPTAASQVAAAVDFARSQGVPVFYVIREHHPSGLDIERTRVHLFANGPERSGATLAGTEGAKLVAPLTVGPTDHVVIKRRFSAFFQTTLDMMLRRLGTQRVLLCGVQTPNCIRAAAFDAVSLDYEEVAGEEEFGFGLGYARAWAEAGAGRGARDTGWYTC